MASGSTILGINYGGHDTSAALMIDGEILVACEQERYTGDKHSRKFPQEAINDCLKQTSLSISRVDEIAYAFDPIYHIREAYLKSALDDVRRIEFLINDISRIRDNYYLEKMIRKTLGFGGSINYYNHHHCHLASTYYPSGYNDAVVVSYDGIGEIETGLIAAGRGGNIEIVHDGSRYPDSLGLLYSAVTFYLGWRHHCDEGIIMGLATYGNPHNVVDGDGRTYYEIFEDIVNESGQYDYHINPRWIAYHEVRDEWVSGEFRTVFGPVRLPDGKLTQHHMDIAAALQLRLETVILNQLEYARESLDLSLLCLSGGVALNCSMNGKIEQNRIFDEIFVQPASGDSGVAVGACYLAEKKRCPELKPEKNHNYYLGSGYGPDEIDSAIKQLGLDSTLPEDIFVTTAQRLAEGKIVGWFQGKAEFGPRALGNRSILTRPFPAEMKDYLNSRVKFRESFRPFAPAVLYDHLESYFDINQESPHMLIACQATDLAREKIPATVHVDNSCRVQSVKRENNVRFHSLLNAFYAKTGCPVLLNTSFNVKGQPIVNTPRQAIECYLSTNIDCLVIGDYFFEKSS